MGNLNVGQRSQQVPAWASKPVPSWALAAQQVDYSEKHRISLYHHPYNPIKPQVTFEYVMPPENIFYHSSDLRSQYLYNWVLLSELWICLCEANPSKWLFRQNSQAWRSTLSNSSNGKPGVVLRLSDLNLTPCSQSLPSSTYDLEWRGLQITTILKLLDDGFLAALMWELSEINFLYSFLMLDQKIHREAKDSGTPDPTGTAEILRRDTFLQDWHDSSSLSPQFDNERGVDALDSEWHLRKVPLLTMVKYMSRWSSFPNDLGASRVEAIKDEANFLAWEQKVVKYYAQTFADHFIRAAPLPCIRPSFPRPTYPF